MVIDETKYALPTDNYVVNESIKKIIVIGHTNNRDMRHIKGWLHRYHNKFKRTAAFTIDAAGSVYRHFDPKYHSRYFNNIELDTKSIVILLENEGWLTRDVVKNEFITWIGDIYNQPKDIVVKNWRGQSFWTPYTDEQIESAKELVKMLCDEFFIPVNPIGHNTKVDDLLDGSTIVYKSNLNKNYTDLSPAWDCEQFKNKLETK
jgi:N-acetyl-anhydromuramyl-L-alanine amidase AmpD